MYLKKLFIILLIIISIVLGLTPVGYADNETQSTDAPPQQLKREVKIINEYQAIKDLAQKSIDELKNKNYSDSQISEIKDYKNVFTKKFNKIKELDEDVVKKMGYSDEQITTLKNFTGEEQQLILLSATCTTTLFCYSSFKGIKDGIPYSDIRFWYDWNWSTEPAYPYTDIVACSWSRGFATDQSRSELRVDYVHEYGTQPGERITYGIHKVHPGAGVDFIFDFARYKWVNNNPGTSFDKWWAKSGTASVIAFQQAIIEDCEIAAEYGHLTIGFEPSVSIPVGLSFSFSFGVVPYGYKCIYVDL